MKKTILIGLAIFTFGTYGFKNVSFETEGVKPIIEWEETSYNFGKIEKDKPVTAVFKFSNKSMAPLVISSVKPSCGCTVAEYPKEPVKAQGSAEIKVVFNAKSLGHFRKSISVNSNASETPDQLLIEGEVLLELIKKE